ncbi:hypothetical protein Tco_0378103 [Tanacetum coccineum]
MCSIFTLPIGVCNDIDKLLKKFLWNSGGQNVCKHSVAWKDVCMQKCEGGLGIKSLQVKLLWYVISDKNSLWVKWVKTIWLKNNSIWAVEPKNLHSWGWKQILALRDKVRSFVHFKVGNGRKVFFWYDRWIERSPLCNLINYNSLKYDSLAMNMRVADLVMDDRWKWPRGWKNRFKEVLNIQVPKLVKDIDDKAIWINKKGKEKHFSVKEVWKVIKRDAPKDSHSHLFFNCTFARRLWERLKGMAKLGNVSNSWAQVISSIVNIPAKNTIWSIIQRLVLGASVYFIWQERNNRLFGGYSRTEDIVFKLIAETVRYRIMGFKLKCTNDVISAADIWNFPIDKMSRYKVMIDDLLSDPMDID